MPVTRPSSAEVRAAVDEYLLDVNGVKFWTPYFINTPKAKGETSGSNLQGFMLGKASALDIKGELDHILATQPPEDESPEGYRKLMFENRLGIECSGFLYHVLNGILQDKLANFLTWSREELLREYDNGTTWHQEELKRKAVEGYPSWIALEQVVKDWGWQSPERVVNIRRIVSIQTCKVFDDVRMIQVGDLIYEIGKDDQIDHAVIVVSVDGNELTCAHSGGTHGRPGYYGGVEYLTITITDPSKPIQHQQWSSQFFLDTHTFGATALRRLKAFDA